MIARDLGKGIPEGNMPFRQSVRNRGVRLVVSEATRRMAHELDDLHSAWIIRRNADPLNALHPSPFLGESQPLRHLDWLVELDEAEDRYLAVNERRQYLQQVLGEMRTTRRIDGKFWKKHEFLAHYESVRTELLYVSLLQTRMKSAAKAHKDYFDRMRARQRAALEKLQGSVDTSTELGALMRLRESVVSWLKTMGDVELPGDLRDSLRISKAIINGHALQSVEVDEQVAMDVLHDRLVADDNRLKGNATNTPAVKFEVD